MQTIYVHATDCFKLAAQYLGDATQFLRIMQQNNLTDPRISSPTPVAVIIPDVDPTQTGGMPTQ